MPSFTKGPGTIRSPFGNNAYLRNTQHVRYEHYTLSSSVVPTETIDSTTQKRVFPGTVIAKITSTGESGKVGPFSAAATDGRQTLANIVGLLDTFLPWELLEHDCDVSVAYVATAVQAWCFELDAGNLRIALTNTTADAMRSTKGLDITFHG